MSILQSIVIGIIQGLTEFLPISSSAHLVIAPYLFGWEIPTEEAFVFDVLVQVATLFAVIIYFWKDLARILRAFLKGIIERNLSENPQVRLGVNIILASIPAGIFGLLLKYQVEQAFANPTATAVFLLANAVLLFAAEKMGSRQRTLEGMNWIDAIWIGLAQVLAIFPGISRSGATISAGLWRNLERSTAARFSFLMSIPIMFAAGILATFDLSELLLLASNTASASPNIITVILAGCITAAVVGYASIHWLLGYLKQHTLYGFSLYCLTLGLFVLSVGIMR